MSFFFPSSPSSSDATSSLTSSPRVGGTDVDVDELATPTTQVSESPRSPITATSTTRAPGSGLLSGSPKAVKLRNSNSNVSGDDNNNGYYYPDNDASVVHPLSRQASDVNGHASATHTRRDHDHVGHGGLSELGVNLEKSVGRLLRLMASGESSESGSLSSFDDDDDASVVSGSWKGKSRRRERESERAVEDTSSTGIHGSGTHRATGGHDVASTNWMAPAAHASTSSALQGTSTSQQEPSLMRAASPAMAIPPPDEEETHAARARTHRRQSSRTHSTHSRKHSRRLVVVHKRQEVGVCKFLSLSQCDFRNIRL